jgi:hypothetical protein
MPPPIQSQSGSKAALITWSVISSIMFVVATVLAIFAHVDRKKLDDQLKQTETRYRDFVSDTDLAGELKTQLTAVKDADPAYANMRLINVVMAQRDALVRQIGGAGTPGENEAKIAAENAIKTAESVTGDKQADNLVAVINALSTSVKAKQDQLKQLQATLDEQTTKMNSLAATFATQVAAQQDALMAARANVSLSETGVSAYRAEKDKQIQEIQAKADEAARLAQEDLNKLQAQIQELTANVKRGEQVVAALQNRLNDLRLPVDQVVQQADARVLRLAGNGVIYIDLGAGDQVVPGMSFEIFDRLQGIPKPGDPTNDDNLPRGKASIEIIKVTPGSSEARIVRQTPGMNVVEGDLAVNIVYDKRTKYNFMVYGNYDLDRNGQATAQDADVIKRLVTQWGGSVTDKLNVDTDFLVVGKVPEIPEYTAEELDRPEIQFELKRKQEELAAYDDVLAKALQLNIPVLNQNRFLYFTGYYEQSGR